MKIYVKKMEGVTLPEKGSEVAAGYDIVATSDPKIVGTNQMTIPVAGGEEVSCFDAIDYIEYETNLFIAPQAFSFHTLIHPRSSISKYNLVLANSIGLVDNDYRGMLLCRFKYVWQPEDYRPRMNDDQQGTFPFVLKGFPNMNKIYKKGDKIAQLVIEPTVMVEWEFVDDLTKTLRGEGGFGSTDKYSKMGDKIVSGPVKFPDHESMAEKYQKLNYIESPKKTYEQLVREQQRNG
jgi:dUTP pyrophosphatase